ILVRAGDRKTAFTQRRRDRPHRRAANSEKMEMSRRFFHSNSLRGVANYASERRKRVIPSAGEGPHLLSWITQARLEYSTPRSRGPSVRGRLALSARLGMTKARGFWQSAVSFLVEYFHCVPRFVGRRLLVFQGALEIHFRQRIVGIKFQEAREQDFRLRKITIAEFANSFLIRFQPNQQFLIERSGSGVHDGEDIDRFRPSFDLGTRD